eukprot:CAMPEP_0171228084 /NCGR_PEP_ID=MMETSP0790-20130122/38180_1 /TAXON_ID=2925 /ORGANISM="Alexandrium catenella, Strain OF101" /LENGTH=148 /DNA_ID=CAMNT_0011694217 /DNA_START=118 /DNA_END=561 /DNA_ORIENTATION=+
MGFASSMKLAPPAAATIEFLRDFETFATPRACKASDSCDPRASGKPPSARPSPAGARPPEEGLLARGRLAAESRRPSSADALSEAVLLGDLWPPITRRGSNGLLVVGTRPGTLGTQSGPGPLLACPGGTGLMPAPRKPAGGGGSTTSG